MFGKVACVACSCWLLVLLGTELVHFPSARISHSLSSGKYWEVSEWLLILSAPSLVVLGLCAKILHQLSWKVFCCVVFLSVVGGVFFLYKQY